MTRLHTPPLMLFFVPKRFILLCLICPGPIWAALDVSKVLARPSGPQVRIQQLQRDETGPTSFRYYAPRQGEPTKTDDWVYKIRDGKPDAPSPTTTTVIATSG